LFILPLIFAALITLYVDMRLHRRCDRESRSGPSLPDHGGDGHTLQRRVDLYLVASAALLLVQGCGLTAHGAPLPWRGAAVACRPASSGSTTRGAFRMGNKAFRLAKMRDAGMPVPYGVLLTPDFLSKLWERDAKPGSVA